MYSKKANIRKIVKELERNKMQCNCDLDKWKSEVNTGHTLVCRIHYEAMRRFKYPANKET